MVQTIRVDNYPISVDKEGYICLTDIAKAKSGDNRAADEIKNWLNTKATIDFLATWEELHNPLFKVVEFHHFRQKYKKGDVLSVQSWIDLTDATGIYSKQGKYGGTYAHKDIAFEFGAAISPRFKLFLIKEYQRLRDIELNADNQEWQIRRVLSKDYYIIQTDAVKYNWIPFKQIKPEHQSFAYSQEADLLYKALWGFTSKQWRSAHLELVSKGQNVRDFASINQLKVLCTLETHNAELMKQNKERDERLAILSEVAKSHLRVLDMKHPEHSLIKDKDGTFIPFYRESDNVLGLFPNQQKKVG